MLKPWYSARGPDDLNSAIVRTPFTTSRIEATSNCEPWLRADTINWSEAAPNSIKKANAKRRGASAPQSQPRNHLRSFAFIHILGIRDLAVKRASFQKAFQCGR